jgi:hypothetical protein
MATASELHKPKSGWGVLRLSPWHLAGVFETSGEAETKIAELGAGYTIRYGDTVLGSDEFVSTDARAM